MDLEYSSSERPKTSKLAMSEALTGTKSLQPKPTPRKVKTAKISSKRDPLANKAKLRAIHKSWPVRNTCFLPSSEDESDDGGATRTSKLHRRKSPKAAKGATDSPNYPSYTPQFGGYQLCALQRMFC